MRPTTTKFAPDTSFTALAASARDRLLRGRRLVLAITAWLAMAALTVTVALAALPGYFAQSKTICHNVCSSNQLTPAGLRNLRELGLSLDAFAWYVLAVTCVFALAFMTVGAIIFWRNAADRTALLAAIGFLNFPLSFANLTRALPASWWLAGDLVLLVVPIGVIPFFFVFPDGHFAPRWTGWLWAAGAIELMMDILFPSPLLDHLTKQYVIPALIACMVAVQIYRYLRVSTPVQRQQTKWVVLGFTAAALGYPLVVGPHRNLPSLFVEGTLPSLIGFGLTYLLFMLIPLTVGIALFRYRLWDVDVLINRIVVYGALTGLLGALYVGLVFGLETLAGRFVGPAASDPPILVASTLLIAALVQPLRQRLQRLTDRHFYRSQYDAAKTLAAFQTALHLETDLEQLRARVLAVVDETMRPACVSLWLRTADAHVSKPMQRSELSGR